MRRTILSAVAISSKERAVTDRPASAPRPTIPVARYSSARQRPDHRYEAWREGSLLSFGRLYDTRPLEPFEVETVSAQLGPVGFSHARMTSQNWARTPDLVRADGADPLMVAIRFRGHVRGDADGRSFDAPVGSAVLSDFSRPQAYFADTSSTAVLAIPRAVAERTLPDVRALHGLVIQPAAAALLRSHAMALGKALDAGVPARQADGLARIALELLEVGIARSMPDRPLSREAATTGVRRTAEAAIERTLDSDALTIDNLVRWTGVSRATLYRAFDADGGIHAYIQRRRLERIAAELRRGRPAPLVEIAEAWGFREVSHMSRVFRQAFGQPPGDYRAWHHLLRAEQQREQERA